MVNVTSEPGEGRVISGEINLGMVGYGRIATRFIRELVFVKGIRLKGVFGLISDVDNLRHFKETHKIDFYSFNYDEFLDRVDAVYIATPHLTHFEYAIKALEKGKHVLCEKPLTLSEKDAVKLYQLAEKNKLVLLEAIKTAYAPGFLKLQEIAGSGIIGDIKNIDATFTKLVEGPVRELHKEMAGGSMTELSSYPLLAAVRLLGTDFKDFHFYSYFDKVHNVDMFTKIILIYPEGIFTGKVGLGVKSEGDLIISGTRGYIYVPAPWWKTQYFEIKFENFSKNQKFSYEFEEDGLRYELSEFVHLINSGKSQSFSLTRSESISIISVIERFLNRNNADQIY
ncbi:MAG TPA: Gfo/Idh/MocA family oxidoreductase [Bacteroidales bacterium]|jgi:choline-phosphate cytidylyltransferase|nr:Gfo/Idh/MocA family oxidoreductase [Bacteroidales bacterium]OQB58557.1 MAG: putative 4,5-dihydroxyphthalate dehydrogenase [Bacteroidetes bacterium ADurb.Bin145]HOU00902.1 Gfo/Idh/MocA family oxidoreductase [Bacteroidales bacterium]HQK66707.1 Gfo/Idh/MocA family oxidoreductase [Bacteroidales bacterium]